jgi:non-ribosomal peptide synthetase component F/thioesterase domain-containing protein
MNPESIANAIPTQLPNAEEVVAFPLSPAQERIWRLSVDSPRETINNGAFRMNLVGPVDSTVLEATFNEIVSRHEILRASVEIINGKPLQVLAPALILKLASHDLCAIPNEQRESELDRISIEEAQRHFDLVKGPLVRASLVKMGGQRFVLLLTVHQVICDGWSIGLIMEELQQIYAAFALGQKSPLSPLAVQFADYVIWQQENGVRTEVAQQLNYWKHKLRRYHRLEIKPDQPAGDRKNSEAKIISHLLPIELTDRLRDLSNKQGGTFFTTTLAACFVLLHRYTGENDISVGSPLAGRWRADIEGLVGQFVNHIVFRADASGDPPFTDFMSRVKNTVWEAFSNQEVPFENVLKALRPGQDPFHEPFYSLNFICQREYGRAATFNFDFAGIRMSTMPSKTQGALYDLNFFLVEREAGWRLSLEYKTSLFRPETAQALLDHFKELLEEIASHPERRISEFQLLGELPAQKRAVSADSAEADVYAMPASSVQKRFWLLDQLDRGNPAFHMLACVRVNGPLDVSALEKSFQLSIQRHESLRTTFREVDGELAQIVSQPSPFLLPVSDLTSEPAKGKEDRLLRLIRNEASDSLDLQKGPTFHVRLFRLDSHQHVLATIIHHILADGWSNKVLQDDVWECYAAISNGESPALAPLNLQYCDFATWQQEWLDSSDAQEHLSFWLSRLQGDLPIIDFPTDRPPTLKHASRGAIETRLLPQDLIRSVEQFAQAHNSTMFTLLLTAFGLLLSRYSGQKDLIIGSPVANRRTETERLIGPFAGPVCLRLDFSGNPTLLEAMLTSRDICFEALSHTELPFECVVDKLKVRSVRGRRPLFQFYFFYQVAFLQARHVGPLTIAPMSTLSTGTPFEMQLAVIKREEGLRAQLEYNPDIYDAATITTVLEDFERYLKTLVANPEARIDSIAAPARKQVSAAAPSGLPARVYEPPRDEVESALVGIWQQLFEQPKIGIHDDFFELGGQSLLAVELMSEIEKKFHRKLNLSHLVAFPTIEGLANDLRGTLNPKNSHIVPLRASGTRVPLICIHCGTGHVFRYRAMTSCLSEDQPVFGLRAPDMAGMDKLPSVEELAALYVEEIRSYQPQGPYQVCGLSFGGVVALEVASQLKTLGEDVSLLALFDTGNPAYYRDVPFRRWIRIRSTYLFDRLQKYGRRILRGEGQEMLEDLSQFVKWRKDALLWKLFGSTSRTATKPAAEAARERVIMFTAIGRRYTPKPYAGRIHLFRAEGRTREFGADPNLGWDEVARDGVEVHSVPGKHVTILNKPHVDTLAKLLDQCLVGVAPSSPETK